MSEIIFKESWMEAEGVYEELLNTTPWVNRNAPRDECFMSTNTDLKYTYGVGPGRRTYDASPMTKVVKEIGEKLNKEFETKFNVCVLNYYKSEKEHLGWHADDSPEQDLNHPIAVVSFGAEREIWTKLKTHKGDIPNEDKYLLTPGSLFIMPGGYQDDHYHKIPKPGKSCGGRISLTFRLIPH